MEGVASVDNPATVPAGLSGIYLEKLESLPRDEYGAALQVLGFCAISAVPLSMAFLDILLGRADRPDNEIIMGIPVPAEDVVNILPKWFKLDEMKLSFR